jgi:hypothetical protein
MTALCQISKLGFEWTLLVWVAVEQREEKALVRIKFAIV